MNAHVTLDDIYDRILASVCCSSFVNFHNPVLETSAYVSFVSKIGDAIPYCAKAISLCKSCIQGLESSKDALLAAKDGDASAAEAAGGSEKSAAEKEHRAAY